MRNSLNILNRAIYSFALILALLSPGRIQAQVVSAEAGTPAPIPANATIREIQINLRDVFDGDNLQWFYRGANNLKINTRRGVIERELLIKKGDKFNQFLIDESVRNLRSLGILNNVSIKHKVEGDQVDLIVEVQDTWTLLPVLNYSSGSGNTRKSVGMTEANIAGTGKRLEFLYDEDDTNSEYSAVWDDPRLLGSTNRLVAAFFDRSDGARELLGIGRPYRSLVEKESWYFTADGSDIIGRLWANGEERFIYGHDRVDIESAYGWARGDPERLVHRFYMGYQFLDEDFSEATLEDYQDADVNPNSVSRDPALLADDRRYSSLFFSYNRIVPEFISANYIDRFERVQDFNLGNDLSVRFGLAPDALGSSGDSFLFAFKDSEGKRFSRSSFIRGEIAGSTRATSGDIENSLLRAEVKYYTNFGPKFAGDAFLGNHTLATGFQLDYGMDLDNDREFLLGADNGLRGYEGRTFTGDKRFLLNIEDRFHLINDLYRLISVGGAVFADIGGSTEDSFSDLIGNEIYSDIGFGFRFGFPRSSGGRVFRVDFAFPLRDGPDGSNAFEIRVLFKGGQALNANLRGDSGGAERANAEIEF